MILPRGNKGEGSSLPSFPPHLGGIPSPFHHSTIPRVPKMEESSPTQVNSMYGIFSYIYIYVIYHICMYKHDPSVPKSSDPSDSVLPFLP